MVVPPAAHLPSKIATPRVQRTTYAADTSRTHPNPSCRVARRRDAHPLRLPAQIPPGRPRLQRRRTTNLTAALVDHPVAVIAARGRPAARTAGAIPTQTCGTAAPDVLPRYCHCCRVPPAAGHADYPASSQVLNHSGRRAASVAAVPQLPEEAVPPCVQDPPFADGSEVVGPA